MSGYIGPKTSDIPVGTIATKGTLSGNSLLIGTNNATIGNSVYIVSNGSVGIGTNSPTGYSGYTTLEVRGPNGGLVQIGNTGTTAGYMFHTGVDMGIASLTSGVLNFYNSNILRMQISNTGNIGIGTSPAYRFHAMANGTSTSHRGNVVGAFSSNGSGYNATFRLSDNVTNSSDISLTGSTVELSVNGVSSLYYNASGYVGIGTTLTTVNDVTAGGRPFIVSKSDSSTTVGGSTASLVIANPNTTANNISQLGFATLYDSSASYWNQSASIGCIFGPRTNTPNYYASGTLVFLTAPGGAANGGNERMRIDSSGNVGIGTNSPASKLTVNGSFRQLAPSTPFEWTANPGAYDYLKLNSVGVLDNLLVISSYGTVGVCTTTALRNNTCLQLRDGIGFPATQVASSDANTLDDYEEGTWGPVMVPGSGTFTSTSTYGKYTKIGRTVFIVASCQIVNVGSATGSLKITSLPFTMRNSGASRPFSAIVREDQSIGYAYQAVPNPNSTETFIGTLTNGDVPLVSNYLYTFSATYITD